MSRQGHGRKGEYHKMKYYKVQGSNRTSWSGRRHYTLLDPNYEAEDWGWFKNEAEAEEWCEQHNIKREELLKKQYAEAQKTDEEIMQDA